MSQTKLPMLMPIKPYRQKVSGKRQGLGAFVLSLLLAAYATKADETYFQDVDLGLTWMDRAAGAAPAVNSGDDASYRKLGLAFFRWNWQIKANTTTSFYFTLRPDALMSEGAKAFDPVAGAAYRPLSAPRLLDAYHLNWHFGPSTDLDLGVFASLRPEEALNHANWLDFGLTCRLPSNFFGTRLRWSYDRRKANAALDSISVYTLDGSNERHEKQTYQAQSFDVGPSGRNPYFGGAIAADGRIASDLHLHYLLGYLEDRGDFNLKVQETFAQIYAIRRLGIWGRELSLISYGAYAFESFYQNAAPELTQMSLEVSAQMPIYAALAGIVQGHYGRSQRYLHGADLKSEYRGYQLDTALVYRGWEGTKIFFSVASEKRQAFYDGKESSGFANSAYTRDSIWRFALSILFATERRTA